MFTRWSTWCGLIAIGFLLFTPAVGTASAGQLTLAWNANTESDLAGYKLRIGNASGVYQTTIDVHNTTTYTATGLTDGQVYYFTVTAYNTSGTESTFSAEVSGTPGGAAPPAGLVAAYGFDDGTGTTASDGSGNGHAGTLSGATWATTGRFGKALSFNGTSSRVIVPDAPALDLTTGMTLEAWLNPAALSGWRTAILKETSTAQSYTLYANNNTPNPASVINVGGADTVVEGTAALPLNTWTHLASTYDGATLRIFVNGVQISTLAVSGSMIQSTGPLDIGGNGIWGEFFSGLIDEVRVYNRALSATEIQADMGRAVVGGAPTDTTAPTVSISAPAAGSVTGTVNVTANAADNVGVASVQFKLDAANLGALDTVAPFTMAWDTTTATNGAHTVTAVARDAAGNSTTSTAVSVTVNNDTTAPVISGVTASAITGTGATIAWTTNEAGDSQVEYGLTTSYGTLTSLNASMVTTHSAALSGLAEVTLYHYRVRSKDAAGNLAMSADATFTTHDATAPAVSITSPAASATVSATITVTATASDNVGVTGVQFLLDGANLGTEDLGTPYAKSWDTTTATNGTHALTAVARDAAGNTKTSTAVSVTVNNDTTAPVISGVTASAITTTGATIGWTTSEASDSQVEYGLTASYGSLTTLNASMVTTHSAAVSGLAEATLYHYRVRSKDAAGNLAMSADATFTTRDVTAPTVSVTSPTVGAVLSATITVSASASDNLAVAGVQFKLDGANLGTEDTATPYTKSWDTKTASNGLHTLTAVARDAAGNVTTSPGVLVTVLNDLTAPLISQVLVSSINAAGATISWQSNEAGDSQIEYGLTTAYGSQSVLNGSLVLAHAGTLTGLAASSQYHFRVRSRDVTGNLATSSDFTFGTRDGQPPSVSLVSPLNGSTVAGTTSLQASASDNVGVAGVSFYVDSVALGTELTSAPYTIAWDTTRLSDGNHVITAVARDAGGDATTSAGISVTVTNGILWLAPQDTSLNVDATNYSSASVLAAYTWPDYQVGQAIVLKFDLSALPAGAVVHDAALNLALVETDAAAENSYNVSAHKIVGRSPVVSAATGYTSDGVTAWTPNACCYNSVPLAQADISPAYDTRAIDKIAGYKTWDLTQVVQDWAAAPGTNAGVLLNADTTLLKDHYRRFASMEYANAALRPFLRVSFSPAPAADTVPPTVSMTAPATGATVTGVVTLSASASDNVGVAGVQFKMDGIAVGAERTAAPFAATWDTSTVSNGAHTLVAVARDAAGNTTGSVPVSLIVANAVATLTPQDTYLNLNTTNYSTAPTLATYTWPDYQVANAILMKFDLSSLPAGAVIQEAVLSLALVTSDSTADPNYTISVHKVVGVNPVLTGATGSKASATTNWAPSSCCYNAIPMAQANISAPYDTEVVDKTPGFKTWTITEMVRDWLTNPGTNSGLLINSDATALRDRFRYFASSENPDATLRPFLTIRYVQP